MCTTVKPVSKPWDACREIVAPVTKGKIKPGNCILHGYAIVNISSIGSRDVLMGIGNCSTKLFFSKKALTEMAELCTELSNQLLY